jgi:hypothetical protein
MEKPKQKQSAQAQARAFRKAAREAGCDDNEERFQDALRTVAKAKPSGEKHKRAQQHPNDKDEH